LVGAIVASLSLRGLFDGDRLDVMLTLPAAKTDDLTVVVFEIIVSFILMWVICGAATDHRAVRFKNFCSFDFPFLNVCTFNCSNDLKPSICVIFAL